MNSGYYAACTGLIARTEALDTIANNLANVGTAGFRASRNVFSSLLQANPDLLSVLNQDANDYGVLSATQLDATANVLGTFTYSPAPGAMLPAGSQVLSVTFQPIDTTDYRAASDSVTIEIARAMPALSVSAPGGTFDGSPFPASVALGGGGYAPAASLEDTAATLTYYAGSSQLNGAPTAVGTYTVVASFAGSANYASASAQSTFAITKATPALTWATAQPIAYFTALSSTQLDATANVSGTFSYSPSAGTLLTAGTRTLSVSFTPSTAIVFKYFGREWALRKITRARGAACARISRHSSTSACG